MDPGEHPVETTRREIHEEAGIVQLDLVQAMNAGGLDKTAPRMTTS
ncbi:MAG: NUDIX domain-containing protein [Solirubrobacteraceae bacterium]